VRWAALLLAVVAGLAGTAAVWAITHHADTVPDRITACATDRGAIVAHGEEGLSFARDDVRTGRMRVARRYRFAPDTAALLSGNGYRILVIRKPQNPPLTQPGLPFRVYRRTSSYASVLTERDPLRVLDTCARRG
jgi:hypothetical protein